jgi:hypothetical protein
MLDIMGTPSRFANAGESMWTGEQRLFLSAFEALTAERW